MVSHYKVCEVIKCLTERLVCSVGKEKKFFLWLKRLLLEAHHSPPSGTEVTNEWICATTPFPFMALTGTNYLHILQTGIDSIFITLKQFLHPLTHNFTTTDNIFVKQHSKFFTYFSAFLEREK
jgi:hypothetical protein